ncbi:MAG: aromatic ring-hydroxylating dioxygenase subunit alpha [Sphingomonadales bacterium]|nr:aromatic ring-hydroxylating dioxygenase subunit alpha [Sphingomonadales bacterium]
MDDTLQQRIWGELDHEASRTGPPEGFTRLPPIPAARYTDPAFHQLELEHVFGKSWLAVAREEDFPQPGAFTVWRQLGKQVLLVRGKDGVIRAFHNTCRHRGAAVTPADSGRTTLLRCQYHSWSYDLTGRLIGVPDEHDFCGLDKSAHGLRAIRCESWGGTVWINFDEAAAPLLASLGSLPEEWACMGMADLRVVYRRRQVIACNWKAAVDAFQEVYHINTIHRESIGDAYNSRAASMGMIAGGHSRMVVAYNAHARDKLGMAAPGTPDIAGATPLHRNASVAYLAFPNLISPFRSIFVQQMRFWPRGVDECEMDIVTLGPDWGEGERPAYWDAAAPAFDKVLDEDMENLGSIQASMRSGALSEVTLSYQERRIYWANQQIDALIGAERIPAGLAVTPVLRAEPRPA